MLWLSVGTKTRERRIIRDSVRPHGHCPPDLKETSVCLAESCHTFNFVNINGNLECVRSDGVVVQGKRRFCVTFCVVFASFLRRFCVFASFLRRSLSMLRCLVEWCLTKWHFITWHLVERYLSIIWHLVKRYLVKYKCFNWHLVKCHCINWHLTKCLLKPMLFGQLVFVSMTFVQKCFN